MVIAPAIDHPHYRALLEALREHVTRDACLEVFAIDADPSSDTPRDVAMTNHLAELTNDGQPMLALLGNLHALKRVRWAPEVSTPSPYAAEALDALGVPVRSLVQRWPPGTCDVRTPRLLPASDSLAATAIRATLAVVASLPEEEPERVAEGVVIWSCEAPPQA